MIISESKSIYRFVVQSKALIDPRENSFLQDAQTMGFDVTHIGIEDLYFLHGSLMVEDINAIKRLLHNPLTQRIRVETENDLQKESWDSKDSVVEVALRPGVTDPVAEQILRAASLVGVQGVQAVASGQRFTLRGEKLGKEEFHSLAQKLLSNPVIQRYALGEITEIFPEAVDGKTTVENIKVRNLSTEDLLALSLDRRSALNLEEMLAIQAYCRDEVRDLTDVEFEMIAQTWSEHCVHKTFKAQITVQDGDETVEIGNLFKETIQAATKQINAPWVRSAFVDNAGVIAFDDTFDLAFKVETHNHPSAIEPFGGANTGVGGVIRDVIGVSAKPIACTDVLCFGPQELHFDALPEGVLHPRRIFSGVVAGIEDYGNKIGVPTVSGAIWYDEGYTANPLVYCGCLGLVPCQSHPRQAVPGDHILILGGRTGRDGLRGATFSSMAMDAQTGEVAGASVQIGAPVVEKGLIDVIVLARDERLYNAITDCGAGGLSSAVGEMSRDTGALVQLARVPLKYAGLMPWEIWLSEAQERMVLAVPGENLERLDVLCARYNVELTDIGQFTSSGRMIVQYDDLTVVDLENHFLHDGLPQRRLTASVIRPKNPAGRRGKNVPVASSYGDILLRLLTHPNIASKSAVIRVYDHEVQGGSVVKPLTGILNEGPSDAVVIKPAYCRGSQALALSAGFNPEYGKQDASQAAVNVVDEAVRNAVAVGTDPNRIAILDNFCWGDPNRPETLGTLVQAVSGCCDAAVYFAAPFISGKDSLNNEYLGTDGRRHAIPPSLLISGLGILPAWDRAVTMDLKQAGSLVYLVGEMQPVFGGSHFNLVCDQNERQLEDGIPELHVRTKEHYAAVHQAMQQGLIKSCHDLSEGGLAVASAEMCIGGGLGLTLKLPGEDVQRWLFGETTGCFLIEVNPRDKTQFEQYFPGSGLLLLGEVTSEQSLHIHGSEGEMLNLDLAGLSEAWGVPHSLLREPS